MTTVLPPYAQPDFTQEDEYRFPVPDLQPQSNHSVALTDRIVVFSGQGRLFGVQVNNTKASAQFVLLFDVAQVPAAGAVPDASFTAAASTNLGIYYGSVGRWMYRGCILVNSSTAATWTAASADCYFDVQFSPQVLGAAKIPSHLGR